MFKPAEWRGEGEMIEKPINELADIRNKIAAAERGVDLANKLNDMDRLALMMAKLQELKAKEEEVVNRMNEGAANQSAFDEAMSADPEVAKQERKVA